MGSTLQRNFNREEMVRREQGHHINVLELMAVKFAILTFTRNLSILTIHIQMDKKVTLSYLLKVKFLKISKSIWHYLLFHGIIITAKYLPSKLNIQADWESRNSRVSSDWKLHQSMFQSVIKSNILDIQQWTSLHPGCAINFRNT